jgi:translation initiation factor RLI1
MVINLPTNLEKATTHRYGSNSFKLHRHATGNQWATRRGGLGRSRGNWG